MAVPYLVSSSIMACFISSRFCSASSLGIGYLLLSVLNRNALSGLIRSMTILMILSRISTFLTSPSRPTHPSSILKSMLVNTRVQTRRTRRQSRRVEVRRLKLILLLLRPLMRGNRLDRFLRCSHWFRHDQRVEVLALLPEYSEAGSVVILRKGGFGRFSSPASIVRKMAQDP
jgi:hypothetical protein